MKIYKFIYYYDFSKSFKKNASPEIPVYTSLSFIQTSNFITLINIILIFSKIKINYNLPLICLVIPPLFYGINYYYFGKKGNGQLIIKNNYYSLGKYSFLINVFSILSYFFAGLTYYFYREF